MSASFVIEGEIIEHTKVEAIRYLKTNKAKVNTFYINSAGGRVDFALDIGFAIVSQSKPTHCYVEYAASAAFQLVMPACTVLHFLPSGKLGFHATHLRLVKDTQFNSLALRKQAHETDLHDKHMETIVTSLWGAPSCELLDNNTLIPEEFPTIPDGASCYQRLIYGSVTFEMKHWSKVFPASKVTIKEWRR